MKIQAMLLLSCAALPIAPANAQQVEFTATLPATAVPSSQMVQLQAFDPSLGILRDVRITLFGSLSGTLSFENTNAQATTAPNYNVGVLLSGTHPTGLLVPSPNPAFEFAIFPPQLPIQLAAFDGFLDFAGPSAVTLPFQNATGTGFPSMTYNVFSDSSLGAWVGPVGPPANVSFQITTADISGSGLPPGIQESHTVTADILLRVRYTYTTLPAAICPAQFSSTCPCTNQGFGGAGCGNSAGGQGGRLTIAGNASISNDTLQLLGSGMTPNSNALYFQGSAFNYQQTHFGDGLRCVFGTIHRLGTKTNSGGMSSYPTGADPSISVRGVVLAPGSLYYQTFYRDPVTFCTPATFNITNGYAVLWLP